MMQASQTAMTADKPSCESVTVPVLITTSSALVGALTIYMVLRDLMVIL